MSTSTWTDERVEQLKKLWSDGLSASQIAKQMGGVTRNAVIGKVHRLGLSGRATPTRPRTPGAKLARPRPSAPSTPRFNDTSSNTSATAKTPVTLPRIKPAELKIEVDVPKDGPKTVLALSSRMCKWPIGDPNQSEFRFCGRKTDGCGPYCEAHANVAYQPSARRRTSGTEEIRMAQRYV